MKENYVMNQSTKLCIFIHIDIVFSGFLSMLFRFVGLIAKSIASHAVRPAIFRWSDLHRNGLCDLEYLKHFVSNTRMFYFIREKRNRGFIICPILSINEYPLSTRYLYNESDLGVSYCLFWYNACTFYYMTYFWKWHLSNYQQVA